MVALTLYSQAALKVKLHSSVLVTLRCGTNGSLVVVSESLESVFKMSSGSSSTVFISRTTSEHFGFKSRTLRF